MSELILRFLKIRSQVIDMMTRLIQETGADCGIIAVPKRETEFFRVIIYGLPENPADEEALLPFESTPLCVSVLETGGPVRVPDVAALPPENSCTFLLAENFAGFLGLPLRVDKTGEDAVLALLSHPVRDWSEADATRLLEAAARIGPMLGAACTRPIQ